MTRLRRLLIAIGAVAAIAGVTLTSTTDLATSSESLALLLGGWAFTGAGIYAWWRRPRNRFGLLLVLAGYTMLATLLREADSDIYIVGELFNPLPIILLIHVLLAFPTGRLEGKWARILMAIAYVDGVVVQCLYVLSWDPVYTDNHGLTNILLTIESRSFYDAVSVAQSVVGIVGMFGIALLLLHRYRAAAPAQQRVLGPVYVAGVVTMGLLSVSLAADVTNWPDGVAEDVIDVFAMAALAMVPIAFVGGLLRVRLVTGGGVSQLVRNVGGASDLRALIADALGDSSVELAFWLPERGRYVDAEGRDVTLPQPGGGRSSTAIDHDGRRVAAIIHDPTLDDARDLVQGAGAAVALALENQRLNAELRARVEELRASRTRIVEAGLAERRRLERDLHDGAQQRLVALRLALRLARDRTAKDPDGAAELLDSASAELDEALAELRELARGIHPAVLTDRGLGPALEALATRAPLPVTVDATASDLPPAIESATYFLVAEALTNVAKYAEATSAHVTVARENGAALVEIRDNGIGGADPTAGSGLSGLADRISALDGTLDVSSPRGGGTTIRAAIPVAQYG